MTLLGSEDSVLIRSRFRSGKELLTITVFQALVEASRSSDLHLLLLNLLNNRLNALVPTTQQTQVWLIRFIRSSLSAGAGSEVIRA